MSSFLTKLGIGKDKNKDKIGHDSVKSSSVKSSKVSSSSGSSHHHSHTSHNSKLFSSDKKKDSLKEMKEANIPISPIPNSAGSTPTKKETSKTTTSSTLSAKTETPLKSTVTASKIQKDVEPIKEEEVKEAPKKEKTSTSSAVPRPTVEKKKFKLDDFVIMQTLGTGSFGRVHLVKHKETGKFYAMKVLVKRQIIESKQVEHTINEKKILETLDHPYMVNLVGSFKDNRNLYIVLEYVCGGELFSYLRQCKVIFYIYYIYIEIIK